MVPDACAAGNYALAVARDLILDGEADAMVVGGVDPYSRVAHTGFNRLLAVSPDLCRPFDARRRGIIPGEGAGILVLESERGARARGAAILAFLLGCGLTNDAGHITNPDPTGAGLARAIALALAESGLAPADVDWISAHGTGTPANDLAETQGIKRAFGERARAVPVSSIKSMIGHTMGAASALEAVAVGDGDPRRAPSRRRSTTSTPTPRATSTTCRTAPGAPTCASCSPTPWPSAASTPARCSRAPRTAGPRGATEARGVAGPAHPGDDRDPVWVTGIGILTAQARRRPGGGPRRCARASSRRGSAGRRSATCRSATSISRRCSAARACAT